MAPRYSFGTYATAVAYPKVGDEAFTEQEGEIAVQSAVNRARCVWRKTSTRDVGIDGQIEYIDAEGNATGRIVAVQVKSGASYFPGEIDDALTYPVPPKHRDYWRDFPLPVILVLYEPGLETAYWADARAQLRAGADSSIKVDRADMFDPAGVLRALETSGPLPGEPLHAEQVVTRMLRETDLSSGCNLSFFDLFFQGLTDPPGWFVYFSMDLYSEVAMTKQELLELPGGLGIGADTFAFIDRYVSFLVAYNLARVDFDAFRRFAVQYGMVGRILAPLTDRGQHLVGIVDEVDDRLSPNWPSRVAQDRAIQMVFTDLPERTGRLEEFKRVFGEAAT